MRRRVWVSLCLVFGIAALALFATSCGSSNKAHLRLLHAMATQPGGLDMLIDGTNVASNVGYSTASSYISVSSGSRHVQIEPTGSSSPVIDTTASLNSGDNVTALAYSTSNANASAFLVDNNSAPSSGNFNLRVINASPAMGTSVDVYVEPIGSPPSGTPLASGLADGSASGYIGLSSGTTWHVIFTIVGQPGSTIFDTDAISSPAAGQIWTVVGLNATSGGLTFVALHDAG